jgi:hypothetical protein
MTGFAQIVSEWETFYLLVGTAAATLTGLLFVAASIHVEVFRREAFADLQHFAALTFNCYFYTLVISILFLIPGLSPLGLGIPLLVLGLLGAGNVIMQRLRARRAAQGRSGTSLAPRFVIPTLCLSALAVLAVGVLFQISQSLYGLVVVIVFLLGSASVNAWTLLVRPDDEEPEPA